MRSLRCLHSPSLDDTITSGCRMSTSNLKRSISNCRNSMAKRTGSQDLKEDFMGLPHTVRPEKRADYIQTCAPRKRSLAPGHVEPGKRVRCQTQKRRGSKASPH